MSRAFGGGGKSGGSQVVGYKYFLGAQLAVCHGPVDDIPEIIIGERLATDGTLTWPSTAISINKPDLFGGTSREGGVVGAVDVAWGDPAQARNTYLASFQGANCPAYRGIVSLIFKSFMWASGNPYFKAPWVRVRRYRKGWRDDYVWNSGYASIAMPTGVDMNPAHIIYQCLTDVEWGMGYNHGDIGDSFATVATTLYNEGFGMSLPWDKQASIEAFVGDILNHIDGTLRINMATGKFELTLNRGGYSVPSLTNINPSNIIEFKSFQRAAYGEFANEVVVIYTDRLGDEKPIAVQDLASIQAQGAVVSTTRQYPGVKESHLAARLAMRDLKMTSTPLAKASITTNRILFDKELGDVISLSWPDRSIDSLPMRVIKIDKGNLTDGKIEVELIEDVFGLPGNAYTKRPASAWVDTAGLPVPVEAARAFEAPYWLVMLNVNRADMLQLDAEYGFGVVAATRGINNAPLSFTLLASPNASTYTDVASGHFPPAGVLDAAITRTQTTIQLAGFYDLASATLEAAAGFVMVDNEMMALVSVNANSGIVNVRRGVLDTVPATHTIGTRMYFIDSNLAVDATERTNGELTYYKPITRTGMGLLQVSSATQMSLTFANRASRPYPPGQFRVNSQYWPDNIADTAVTFTWVGRDRLQQTVSLIDYSQGNVGPEPGTSYTLRLYDNLTQTLLRTYSGSSTSYDYSAADQLADGYLTKLRATLISVVGGVESLYPHEVIFERYGMGFHLGDSLGGTTPI